jgi:hypothetical protein
MSATPQKPRAGLQGFDAYTNALAFYRAVADALHNKPKGHVPDQLTRAAESVVLNVAEAHPALGADRARASASPPMKPPNAAPRSTCWRSAAPSQALSSPTSAASWTDSAPCCGGSADPARSRTSGAGSGAGSGDRFR